ncbi:stage V sporulation protein AB [Peribacillus asahii]|uniref:Stage V sporulation protein AB n=1 Tax=Peribacillus asahii TaxID=228899 RepID=A0A398BKL2_9BACI|nr:stage V sporulation protein AB [Peribacillus asahii]RID89521.1 stage V sporulation protein AB [Peribacillus asahii]
MTGKVVFGLFIGLASGFAVGAGFVAFVTVLGVIPRLTQLTKTMQFIHYYEAAIIAGVVIGTWLGLQEVKLFWTKWLLVPIGLADGIFNGMLAAALTEVLNVFPILAKRMGIQEKVIYLMMALVLGKIIGSLFQWIYYVDL